VTASNWADCPRCLYLAAAGAERRITELRDSYGKVSADEYAAMAKAATVAQVVPRDPTFREDYEIFGARDGVVKVSYSGSCAVCGLGLDFTTEKLIEGITDE
jgi:hypothetical protein